MQHQLREKRRRKKETRWRRLQRIGEEAASQVRRALPTPCPGRYLSLSSPCLSLYLRRLAGATSPLRARTHAATVLPLLEAVSTTPAFRVTDIRVLPCVPSRPSFPLLYI